MIISTFSFAIANSSFVPDVHSSNGDLKNYVWGNGQILHQYIHA